MTTYKPAYPTARADSMNSLTFETDKHLYKPGEHVSIEGSILTSVLADLGDVSFVVLEVTDNKGHIVAEDESDFDSDGMFEMAFTLPEDSELGAHTVKATVEADAELLGTLDASIQAQLSKSIKFAVVSPVAFAVKAEDKDFEVNVASNSSEVRDFAFEQAEKKIEFTVEGETGTRGVAQVTLPRELLAGEMTVSIDGRVIAEDSNDVIVTSDTATEMTLEINYPHSEHTIEIVGTSVVPEFPISMLVMVGALGSVVAAVTIASRSKFAHRI
jgi:MG2 domain-containing protein